MLATEAENTLSTLSAEHRFFLSTSAAMWLLFHMHNCGSGSHSFTFGLFLLESTHLPPYFYFTETKRYKSWHGTGLVRFAHLTTQLHCLILLLVIYPVYIMDSLKEWHISSFSLQILEVNGQNFENVQLSKANEILKNNTHLSITVKTNLLGKVLGYQTLLACCEIWCFLSFVMCSCNVRF